MKMQPLNNLFLLALLTVGLTQPTLANTETTPSFSCPTTEMLKSATPILAMPYAFDNKHMALNTLSVALLEDKTHNNNWAIVMTHLPISADASSMDTIQATLGHVSPVFINSRHFQVLNNAYFGTDENDPDDDPDNVPDNDSDDKFLDKHAIDYCVYRSAIPNLSVFAVYGGASDSDESTLKQMHRLQKQVRIAKLLLK